MTYIFFTDTSLSKCVSITNQKAKYTDFSNINLNISLSNSCNSIKLLNRNGSFIKIFIQIL